MAGYNEIRGLRVKYLSADPSNAEDGQVWYNSTSGNLRVAGILAAGTWASGGAVNAAGTTASNASVTYGRVNFAYYEAQISWTEYV